MAIKFFKINTLPADEDLQPSSLYYDVKTVNVNGDDVLMCDLVVTTKSNPVEKIYFDSVSLEVFESRLALKLDKIPNGTRDQYYRGDGTLGTFADDLYAFMRYMGTKDDYDDLAAVVKENGDVYNIVNEHLTAPEFPAGSFLIWNSDEEEWDVLGTGFDFSGKLDRVETVTENTMVYGKLPNGAQTMIDVTDFGGGGGGGGGDFDGIETDDSGGVKLSGNGLIGTPLQASVEFLGITDTPSDYAGQAGKVVKVKSGEDGLEFGDESGGDTPTLSEVLAEGNLIDGYFETVIEFENPYGTNSKIYNEDGASYFGTDSDNGLVLAGNGSVWLSSTSELNLNNQTFPSTSGTAGQVLTTDGANTMSWQDATPTLSEVLEEGNFADKDIEFDYGNHTIRQYLDSGGVSILEFNSNNGTIRLAVSNNSYTLLNINEDNIIVEGHKKGIVGIEEFNKQGDRKAFAQIADVQDSLHLVIEKAINATAVSTSYVIDLAEGAGNFNIELSGATDFSFTNMITEDQSCVFTIILDNAGEEAFQFPLWLEEEEGSSEASTYDRITVHIHKGGVSPVGTYQITNL